MSDKKDDIEQHIRHFTEDIYEDVPEHEPREEFNDDFYQQERKKAIEAADGCFVCGRTEEDLKNDDGYGEYLETHHWACEWSLWHAVDKDKLQKLFDLEAFDPYGFCKQLKGQPVEHPGDRRNLLVLCPRHHRYKPELDKNQGGGIHIIDGALWPFQMVKKDDFDLFEKSVQSSDE